MSSLSEGIETMKHKREIVIAAMVAVSGWSYAQGEAVLPEATDALNTMAKKGLETLEWGLLVEAEGGYEKTGAESASDLVLATVEFILDAAVNDWLSGHVGLLWEEDDTEENNLDEAYITAGSTFYAQVGRFYLPFGNFASAFISDPLTLELAEISHSSAMVGYGNERFNVCAGAFKGDDEDVIENVYAAANVSVCEWASVGAYYLSDIMETGSQTEIAANVAVEKEAGAGAYLSLFIGPVTVNAEYVTALDDVAADTLPSAYNLEASVEFAECWCAGLKYEGSDELSAWDEDAGDVARYHETGYGAVISCGFRDHAAIALEYMHLVPEDGNEDDTDLVTVQLAFDI
jgi:hypothetical protein